MISYNTIVLCVISINVIYDIEVRNYGKFFIQYFIRIIDKFIIFLYYNSYLLILSTSENTINHKLKLLPEKVLTI